MYLASIGVNTDSAKTFPWYLKFAEKGMPGAIDVKVVGKK